VAAKDIKIYLKTFADVTGLSKLASYLKQHISGLGAVKAAYSGLKAAGSAALDALGAAWRAARRAALGLSAAMAGSVREFYVWNKEAARAWTMMDAGVEGFTKLRKEISKLSPELGVAKSELGKGWYQALSAGVAENDLIDFLRTAAKVSVADGSTIEGAIDGITTVLNAYGMQSSEAAAATDMMFKTVAKGKTTFGELAAYISQAAPAAAAMGVGLDQVLAATATMTKQGIPTATAMVQIRNSILGLNKAMGDGWSQTMTLQEALEAFAKEGEYSALAIEKAFGRENVSGVMALIGKNAAAAAADLAMMRAEGGGLEEAFRKVDSQVGHWPRVWQSIRAIISDIGEVLDRALKPAINYISAEMQKLRDSGGFTAFVENLAARVTAIVEGLIAGVKTVVDLVGKASTGSLISGTINALVDTVITLLAEGLRGLGTVMVALAKIFSAALAADFMKIDIWGRNELKDAQKAAAKKIPELSEEEAQQLGLDMNYFKQLQSTGNTQLRGNLTSAMSKRLDLDQATAVATYSKDADVNAAIAKAFSNFAASRERLGGAGERIAGNLGKRTGVDLGAMYTANLNETRASFAGQSSREPMRDQIAGARSRAEAMGSSLAAGANDGKGDDAAERQLLEENRQLREKLQTLTETETETFAAITQALQAMERKYRDLKTAVGQIPNA